MSENGEIYTTGKNFTLPPAVTAWTNSTSGWGTRWQQVAWQKYFSPREINFASRGFLGFFYGRFASRVAPEEARKSIFQFWRWILQPRPCCCPTQLSSITHLCLHVSTHSSCQDPGSCIGAISIYFKLFGMRLKNYDTSNVINTWKNLEDGHEGWVSYNLCKTTHFLKCAHISRGKLSKVP